MNNQEIIAELNSYLPKDEQYIGAFFGTYTPVWAYIIGGYLAIRQYRVAVSNRKLYFHRLNLLGKIKETQEINHDAIAELIIKNIIIGYKFIFNFSNGKKLALMVPFRKGNNGVILNEQLLQYLQEKLARQSPELWEKAPISVGIKQPILAGIAGHFANATVKLVKDEWITIGRDPSVCQLVFPNNIEVVSRKHCRIKFDSSENAFILQDLGSSYGTFLSVGKQLSSNENEHLKNGDRFYLCNRQSMFEVILENT
jgi:hypothetical protein